MLRPERHYGEVDRDARQGIEHKEHRRTCIGPFEFLQDQKRQRHKHRRPKHDAVLRVHGKFLPLGVRVQHLGERPPGPAMVDEHRGVVPAGQNPQPQHAQLRGIKRIAMLPQIADMECQATQNDGRTNRPNPDFRSASLCGICGPLRRQRPNQNHRRQRTIDDADHLRRQSQSDARRGNVPARFAPRVRGCARQQHPKAKRRHAAGHHYLAVHHERAVKKRREQQHECREEPRYHHVQSQQPHRAMKQTHHEQKKHRLHEEGQIVVAGQLHQAINQDLREERRMLGRPVMERQVHRPQKPPLRPLCRNRQVINQTVRRLRRQYPLGPELEEVGPQGHAQTHHRQKMQPPAHQPRFLRLNFLDSGFQIRAPLGSCRCSHAHTGVLEAVLKCRRRRREKIA